MAPDPNSIVTANGHWYNQGYISTENKTLPTMLPSNKLSLKTLLIKETKTKPVRVIIERASNTCDQKLKVLFLHAANVHHTLLCEIHNGYGRSTAHP